jgi:serine/threonine-protein kinase
LVGTFGGRYEIQKWIGAGGMQHVYLATDKLFGRRVALKTPKEDSGNKRFQSSAVVSAKVNQGNVAKTLDYFLHENKPVLIEEYVEGKDLSGVMEEGFPYLPPSTCARIFHQLSKGLAASHAADVIHRDLKPSNIMVVGGHKFTEAKITDFGIAKMAAEEIGSWDGKGSTTSKTILGAIPYMAPESIMDFKSSSKASDVWSIAAIIYELMSGNCPFGTGLKSIPAILEAKTPPRPKQLAAAQFRSLGGDVYDLIVACLNKDPSARLTASDLVIRCGQLCYGLEVYGTGTISGHQTTKVGFISAKSGRDLMFHRQNFYGDSTREVGRRVWFARHPGQPNDRAFPIVELQSPS